MILVTTNRITDFDFIRIVILVLVVEDDVDGDLVELDAVVDLLVILRDLSNKCVPIFLAGSDVNAVMHADDAGDLVEVLVEPSVLHEMIVLSVILLFLSMNRQILNIDIDNATGGGESVSERLHQLIFNLISSVKTN